MRKITVVVLMTAVLAMMLASAGMTWAGPGGNTNGKGARQGQGPARACGAFAAQWAHGKSAHARDLDRLDRKLDQHGCPPAPPCVATDSCDAAPPPPLGGAASCEGVTVPCVVEQSPVFTLYGTLAAGPSSVKNVVNCPEDAPNILNLNYGYTASSSAVTVLMSPDPSTTPQELVFTGVNWAPIDDNTFQVTVACTSSD